MERNPSVDGDGSMWMIACELGSNISGLTAVWDPVRATAYLTPLKALTRGGGKAPNVAWAGESYLVSVHNGATTQILSLDEHNCTTCEATSAVTTGVATARLVSQRSSSPTAGSEAMLVWGKVKAQRYRPDDGATTNLGGGCGQGGAALASCAVVGHSSFTPRLRAATPTVLALVVLGVPGAGFVCGPCNLVPDLATAALLPIGTTNSAGEIAVNLPIPASASMSGGAFVQQWITLPGSGCGLFGGFDLSIALQVTVQ